jgi:hypothetical protein
LPESLAGQPALLLLGTVIPSPLLAPATIPAPVPVASEHSHLSHASLAS